jgi:hypothetical protein
MASNNTRIIQLEEGWNNEIRAKVSSLVASLVVTPENLICWLFFMYIGDC